MSYGYAVEQDPTIRATEHIWWISIALFRWYLEGALTLLYPRRRRYRFMWWLHPLHRDVRCEVGRL